MFSDMFAFTKEQKLMKLYRKTLKLYDTLYEEYSNYNKNTQEETTIVTLTLSKYNLELEKMAANFDQLRDSIPGIDNLRSIKDSWKLQKTNKSEGRVYDVIDSDVMDSLDVNTTLSEIFTSNSSASLQYEKAIKAMTGKQRGLVAHVRKLIKKKLKKLLKKSYLDVEAKYGVVVTTPEEVSTVNTIKFMQNWHGDILPYIHFHKTEGLAADFLPRVAKALKTNIIVIG